MAVTLTCEYCKATFTVKQSEAMGRRFCSSRCMGNAQRDHWARIGGGPMAGKKHSSQTIAKMTGRKYAAERCAAMSVAAKNRIASGKWKSPTAKYAEGDKYINSHDGYVYVIGNSARKPEHRMIAEKALGRKLRENEVVHHVNGDKTDNRNSNLLVCDRPYHAWLHGRMADLYTAQTFGRKAA